MQTGEFNQMMYNQRKTGRLREVGTLGERERERKVGRK